MKKLTQLKYLLGLLIIIIIIELAIIGSKIVFQEKESLYFDGINSIINSDSSYITVGSNNDNHNHYEKAKISKYNKKHEKTFERLYSVGYNSSFFGVSIDKDNIVAVGSYEKEYKSHKDSVRKALIVKYDSNGELLFDKDFSLLDNSKFTKVMVVDDGYLVCGQSVYKNTKVGSKEGGAILVKYNRDGKILWSKTFGDNKSALFNDFIILDNYIYIVGMRDTYIGVICKYDLDGNLITYKDYNYTDELGFTGIVSLNGYIYVSGSKRIDYINVSGSIIKYDRDCNFLDEVNYNGEGNTRFHKIISDNDNNIIVIGVISTNKNKGTRTADVFNYDGLIGKYNSSLEKAEINSYGEERDDYFTDIIVEDKKYLVVGYSAYEDGSYLSKLIFYSDALKVLEVS